MAIFEALFLKNIPVIISRPQTSTVTSFVFFLVITIIVSAMNIMVVLQAPRAEWYNYAIIIVLIPIGLVVLYKIFIRYKVLRLGNNQIQISYPVLRQTRHYPLDQISGWVENSVKTGKNSVYKELQIRFADGAKLDIGHKEHTEYARMVQYLQQKVPKKKAQLR
ncbi:MAG: hypothetical protein JSS79_06465 [Bacteroidetes bacterium]|nr:hypothetical protein [Bacteroidota bacterium]